MLEEHSFQTLNNSAKCLVEAINSKEQTAAPWKMLLTAPNRLTLPQVTENPKC